jgi:uncharacterized repeat protein (TIGR02543 family)
MKTQKNSYSPAWMRLFVAIAISISLIFTSVPVTAHLFPSSESDNVVHAVNKAKKITVKFKGNGGKVSKKSKRVTRGKKYGTLPTATRSGYAFKGWYTKKSGGKRISKKSRVSSYYRTLYAHWIANTYTITFDGNGGTVALLNKTVKYGSTFGTLPVPTRQKHEFAGWYTEAIGGKKITEKTIVELSMDRTLYAHWIIKGPVNLANLDYFTKKGDWGSALFDDNEGVAHRGWGIDFNNNSFGRWATTGDYINFILDCEYYELNGKLCLLYERRNTAAEIRLNIYCDNVLVHTTGILTSGVRPIEFPTIDLTNVEQLKFEVEQLTSDTLEFGIDAELLPL